MINEEYFKSVLENMKEVGEGKLRRGLWRKFRVY